MNMQNMVAIDWEKKDLEYRTKKPNTTRIFKLFEHVPLVNTLLSKTIPDSYLCGGAARSIETDEPIADYDFFFRNPEGLDNAREILKTYYFDKVSELKGYNENWSKVFPNREIVIQLMYKNYYSTIELVLDSFDFSVTQFGLDEDGKFWYTNGGIIDAQNKFLRLVGVVRPKAVLRHAFKYAHKGYDPSVFINEFCDMVGIKGKAVDYK